MIERLRSGHPAPPEVWHPARFMRTDLSFAETTSAMRQGNLMMEFKVAIITPTTGICRMSYAQSWAKLVMYFSQVQVYEGVETQYLTTDSIEGSGIGANYHEMVKRLLKDTNANWTHILSIEDDMGFEPDILHILANRKLPFIGCTYKTNKGRPMRWTAIDHNGNPLGTDEIKTGVEEAYVIPQGFTLVAREVYENTPKPWFMQGYCHETDSYSYVQDYNFALKAREAGYPCYIDRGCFEGAPRGALLQVSHGQH